MSRIISFLGLTLAALFLWPLALCLGFTLVQALLALPWREKSLMAFGTGVLAYALVQLLFWKPLFMYVMGHELTHALAALLQGGHADELHVSSRGGAVKVNRSNLVVNLAPYVFPIYTFGVVLVYLVADRRFILPLVFLLGFTLAFHLALTVFSLKEHQSDLEETGWFFSLPLIASVNLVIAAFVVGLCVPGTLRTPAFLQASWRNFLLLLKWFVSVF